MHNKLNATSRFPVDYAHLSILEIGIFTKCEVKNSNPITL